MPVVGLSLMTQDASVGESRSAKPSGVLADFWGGLAAMLVALPSAIAFGVAAYSPLGAEYVAVGATAGILGAFALGLVAPLFGGAPRLITAPCAPAAAVMGALAASLLTGVNGPGTLAPERILLFMALVGLISGILQLVYGVIGGGKLIKYIPYPVVSGYLSGVGLIIILSQIPKLFGFPKEVNLWMGLVSPDLWKWPGLVVGGVTMALMVLAPRLTKAVPAAILALLGGILTYFGLALVRPELLELAHNKLIIGPIGGAEGSLAVAFMDRMGAISQLQLTDLQLLLIPALMLSVLLSIDTLKTCVVVDAITESRHDSNRELMGQGLGNLASAILGGMPGAGTMGATMVSISSGGASRLAGVLEGVFVLLAFLLLGKLVAWVPIGALAGILIVVAFRMVDRSSLRLLRNKSTVFDFLVIAAVVGVAVGYDLIAASGTGLALAIFLFIRDQIRGQVLRRKSYGSSVSSKRHRLATELAVLERKGRQTVICELQGNLFFGTTDQLLTELEPDLKDALFVILDMRRVQSVDFTAVHMLEQAQARLSRREGRLLFANIPQSLPTGQDLNAYFGQLGLVRPSQEAQVFDDVSDALEWTEDRILEGEHALRNANEKPLAIQEFDLLKGCSPETVFELSTIMTEKSYEPGQKIFSHGERSDELYLVRRGEVKIVVPLEGGKSLHLDTFTRGDFFGDMAFLDPGVHSADAVATVPTDLYSVSRDVFDLIAEGHHRMNQQFFVRLAETLAARLKRTNRELRALRES